MERLWQTHLPLQGVDGNELMVKGIYEMDIAIIDRTFRGQFYMIKNLSSDVLLGSDFIQEHSLIMMLQPTKFSRAMELSGEERL